MLSPSYHILYLVAMQRAWLGASTAVGPGIWLGIGYLTQYQGEIDVMH
jgi:hypothetical protein